MKLVENAPSRRRIGLTPLIDVVFLLLVFFMLASTFLKFSGIPIATAGAGANGAVNTQSLVLVHVSSDDTWRVNGKTTPREDLVAALDTLKASGRERVILVMRKGASAGDMVAALDLVRKSRFETIQVVK